jgi:hypothetical protein
MSSNNLKLLPVNDLLGKTFVVPDYQRGYRWTKKEVKALVEDIWNFFLENRNSPNDVYYCLQPVVVIEKNGQWILVDGQQRLTTIHLILTFLKDGMLFLGKEKYTIIYETRSGSEAFLKNLNEEEKFANIDFYYMWEAFEAITEWFNDRDGSARSAVLNTLLYNNEAGKNVKVIWYEIDPQDAVAIFTRINMGKIPLTNAELIKALFLKKDNFSAEEKRHIYNKQLEIASEWDRIENTLQKDAFWYFIHDNPVKYDTRIEFIFDLIKGKTAKNDDYFTFVEFSRDFETKDILAIWAAVKRYFMTLEEWFYDRNLFHYVGFLVVSGSKIQELFDHSGKLTKSEFKTFLKDRIKDKLGEPELDSIEYGSAKSKIKNILLLHNIETILQNTGSNIRFQFDAFQKQSWDIEHISSSASDMPSALKSRKWLENIRDYFVGSTVLDHYEKSSPEINDIVNEILRLLQKEYSDQEFARIYDRVLSYFKEGVDSSEGGKSFTDSIANLTLLDSGTNRSYQNSVFPVKRKQILKSDIDGLFVPVCTKNVFLKYYSNQLNDVMFWQKSDAEAYLQNMESVLAYYL